jgi:hypothetical protein
MKKARAWLDGHGVGYDFHDYKTAGIAKDRLKRWSDELGWETLLNRAGTTFRKLPDADKEGLNERKALALMLAIAADMLEASPSDLELGGGRFTVRGSPSRGIDFDQVEAVLIRPALEQLRRRIAVQRSRGRAAVCDDLCMVERRYAAERLNKENTLRRDILTFLNNFRGEVDRALAWCEKHPVRSKTLRAKPVEALHSEAPPPDPEAEKKFLADFKQRTGRLPYGYSENGHE